MSSTSLARPSPGSLSRQSRATSRDIDLARSDGVVAAARVEAASFATHVALHHAAILSNLEAQLIERTPLGERRYEAIVNSFVGTACSEIAALSVRSS